MKQNELLKLYNILYVEDDESILNTSSAIFGKLFKKVYVAKNGKEGLEVFRNNSENIDIIISDINMPIMNGIEMLEEIRNFDKKIDIIYTSAHTETKFFLKAIDLRVNHYVVKPIDMRKLIIEIYDIIGKKLKEIEREKVIYENEKYLEIINHVAIISKTDLEGNITYANDIFLEVSGYTEAELLNSPHNIIRHSDVSKDVYKSMWQDLHDKKVWKGKIKNKAKDGTTYYVKSTIFPIYDVLNVEVKEYMSIQFITTKEEMEKIQFQKKVIIKLKELNEDKKKEKEKYDEAANKIAIYETSDDKKDQILMEKYNKEKSKNNILEIKIKEYENDLKFEKENYMNMLKEKRKETNDQIDVNKKDQIILNQHKEEMINVRFELSAKDKIILAYEKEKRELEKRILVQKDIIDNT